MYELWFMGVDNMEILDGVLPLFPCCMYKSFH